MKIVGFFFSAYMHLWQKQRGLSPSLGRWDWDYVFFALTFFFLLQFIFLFCRVCFCNNFLFCSPHFLTSVTDFLHNSFHKEIQAINSKGRYLQCYSTICKQTKAYTQKKNRYERSLYFILPFFWELGRNLSFNT